MGNSRSSAARAGHKLPTADSNASLEDAELKHVITLSQPTVCGVVDNKVFSPRPGGTGRVLGL